MKSTVVDESLSSFKPMYCSREYQTSTRLIQQYEKSTLNTTQFFINIIFQFYAPYFFFMYYFHSSYMQFSPFILYSVFFIFMLSFIILFLIPLVDITLSPLCTLLIVYYIFESYTLLSINIIKSLFLISNVLMLSLEHVLSYKILSFYLYTSEIHYIQTFINILKCILQGIIYTTYYTPNIINILQYTTSIQQVSWPMANRIVVKKSA